MQHRERMTPVFYCYMNATLILLLEPIKMKLSVKGLCTHRLSQIFLCLCAVSSSTKDSLKERKLIRGKKNQIVKSMFFPPVLYPVNHVAPPQIYPSSLWRRVRSPDWEQLIVVLHRHNIAPSSAKCRNCSKYRHKQNDDQLVSFHFQPAATFLLSSSQQ